MCPFSVGSAEGGGPGFVCVLVCAHVCVRVCMRGVCVYVCLWVCVCTYAQGLGQGLCVTLELVRKPATSYWKPGAFLGCLPAEHREACRGMWDRTVRSTRPASAGARVNHGACGGRSPRVLFHYLPAAALKGRPPYRPWYTDGGPEARRGWAWPLVGGELRFEHGSRPLRAQVESEPRHRGAMVIPGWRCSLHSAPSSSCSEVRVPSLGPGSMGSGPARPRLLYVGLSPLFCDFLGKTFQPAVGSSWGWALWEEPLKLRTSPLAWLLP